MSYQLRTFNCQSESPSRSLGCRDVEACSDRTGVVRNFSWVVLLQRFKSHIKILEHCKSHIQVQVS
ncbi:hypothetical protein DAI22_12g105600 [Oryza sativa Japonica Group]|nr:hypothetical protein DAI22_12g105600 [Oryza sativa Japonica Group]